MANFEKTALDNAAKEYWKLLFGEYGEALVRDIPRRIKAALLENKKVASVDDSADVRPVAAARHNDGMLLEGVYNDGQKKLLFRASIDSTGNIEEINTIEIR